MDMTSGFLAANCIDFTSDNKVDTSTKYIVYITSFTDASGLEVDLYPSDITIHPNYDPTTFANNIAIIQFNKNTTDNYISFIKSDTYIGETEVYVRRSFNEPTGTWNPPTVVDQDSDDGNCAAASALYAANPGMLTCTSAVTTSTENGNCSMPYGLMYRQNYTDVIVSSNIYSHSVVYGNNMCNGPVTTFSYYTDLWTYVGFAGKVLNRPINVFGPITNTTTNDITINSMNQASKVDVAGAIIVGGDLYKIQRDMVDGSSTTSVSETESATDSTDIPQLSGIFTDEGATSSGLSRGGKIAIGVSIPLGVVVIAIGSIAVYRMWSNKRKEKDWNPEMEETQLRTAALELNLDEVLVTPPPYSAGITENASTGFEHARSGAGNEINEKSG
ncbi:hypothetical protein IW138_004271 [Coemansia sp. RSA 986]|nr:hypothetical protein IW138_004271 [Coemansia sp. RSA 986]